MAQRQRIPHSDKTAPPPRRRMPCLGILFECCNVYRYIYKKRGGNAYAGACPRCGRRVVVPIGPEGTASRFFRAR